MAKKEITTAASPVVDILAKLRKANKTASASQLMAEWDWVDFLDPIENTPCLLFEWLFGARGFLTGKAIKVEADPAIGKSSFLLLQSGMAQKTADAYTMLMESEGTPPPPDYIATFGCDPHRLIVGQPRSIESCMDEIENLVYSIRTADSSERPIIIGVDSISGLGSASAYEGEDDANQKALDLTQTAGLGAHARTMSRWFRDRGGPWLTKTRSLLLITAQLKANIQIFGTPQGAAGKTTIAQNPLDFNSSTILRLTRNTRIYDKTDKADKGLIVSMTVRKDKLSGRTGYSADIPLYKDTGFSLGEATIDMLRKISPITLVDGSVVSVDQRGAWVGFDGKNYQSNRDGKTELANVIYANEDLLMALRETFRVRGFGFDFEAKYMPEQ